MRARMTVNDVKGLVENNIESIKKGKIAEQYFVDYYNISIKDLFGFDEVQKCRIANDKILMLIGHSVEKRPYYVMILFEWFYTSIKELKKLAAKKTGKNKICQKLFGVKNDIQN